MEVPKAQRKTLEKVDKRRNLGDSKAEEAMDASGSRSVQSGETRQGGMGLVPKWIGLAPST